jgi:hypothetical protein
MNSNFNVIGTEMLSVSECRALAARQLLEIAASCDTEIVILDEHIDFGQIVAFFYQSVDFLRTRDHCDALAGNGPILVSKTSGEIGSSGTAMPLEEYVRAFERQSSIKSQLHADATRRQTKS